MNNRYLKHFNGNAIARALMALVLLLASQFAAAERIKDLGTFAGVRGNQLIGYGLVVGLDGSGDQTTRRRRLPCRASRTCSLNWAWCWTRAPTRSSRTSPP